MVKNPPAKAGGTRDSGLIPGLGRSPGGGNGNLFNILDWGKSHGQRSLEGYSPWGHKESDMTEHTNTLESSGAVGDKLTQVWGSP